MKFKIGDQVIVKTNNIIWLHVNNAVGTVSKIDCPIMCENWSLPFSTNETNKWYIPISEIELNPYYLQQQEAKRLLGIK